MTAIQIQQTYATMMLHAKAAAHTQKRNQSAQSHAAMMQTAMTENKKQLTHATTREHAKAAAQTLNKKQKLNCPALNREKQKANDLETKQ
jgi:hypothetical protein